MSATTGEVSDAVGGDVAVPCGACREHARAAITCDGSVRVGDGAGDGAGNISTLVREVALNGRWQRLEPCGGRSSGELGGYVV